MANKSEVLIIGGGAAGLMAAHTLAKSGKKVTVLEARNRLGGRIHTIYQQLFFKQAELGAEFIHGDLPVTIDLLKEAGIAYNSAGAKMVRYNKGKFSVEDEFIEHWDLLLEKLNELRSDTSIAAFMDEHFNGDEYKTTRDMIWRYVSGYDTADPRQASAFALRKEWQAEEMDAQHRVEGGYCHMIDFMATSIRSADGSIFLDSPARTIKWQNGKVSVTVTDGTTYEAGKLIIAMPLGLLQLTEQETGTLTFEPEIPDHMNAAQQIGFGSVIKFLLEFDEAFWENEHTEKLAGISLKDMGYLLSDKTIPTWWTQYPLHTPLLTGWLGGPPAEERKNSTTEELLNDALASLSSIFGIGIDELKAKLIAESIINWTTETYTRGSYAYDKVGSAEARKLLMQPIENTIYFAGEYLYEGPSMGTVEAALTSGLQAAGQAHG